MKSADELKNKLSKLLSEDKVDFQQFLETTSEFIKYDDEHLRFQTDSGTINHLGKGSIKDHTTAILELVKNSYDADAENVEIEINYYSEKEKKESYIRIADNGVGMSKSDVINKWLRIGYSSKRINKITVKDRRKTGEKGIGRISADRLGAIIILKTKSADDEIFDLEINWNDFNKQGVDLNLIPFKKIKSNSINLPKRKDTESNSGTEIIIKDLRDDWTNSHLQRLYEEISVLTSPFKVVQGFNISISSNIKSEYVGEFKPKEHISPEMQIAVIYDGESEDISYSIKDRYNISDEKDQLIAWNKLTQKDNGTASFIKDVKNLETSKDLPKCGPVLIDLMFYPVDGEFVKTENFTLKQLKEYLSYNGGIKVYRDNISVKPYGFSSKDGEDWLNLGERQGRNPAGIGRKDWMVKNNQMLGAVYINRDENSDLLDSSAREGLIHNDAYYDLRALVLSGVRLLESYRYKIYKEHKIRESKPRESYKKILDSYKNQLEDLSSELKNLKMEAKKNDHLYVMKASSKVDSVLSQTIKTEKTIEELLDKNRTLGGLATIGIASAVFGHETQSSITQFKMASEEAQEMLIENPPDVKSALNELKSSIELANQVSAWGSFALSRIKRDKRKRKKVKLKSLIEKIIQEITPTFISSGITANTILEDITAITFSMDIETVIVNLLTNSYSACVQVTSERLILIELKNGVIKGKKGFEIIVTDSGIGIDESNKEIIWEALYSNKVDHRGNEIGTGLGLTIIQSIVDDLGGCRKVENSEKFGGARFSIWFPSK